MTTCDCDETSCKAGCTKTHTCKTYSCDACNPKSPSITETISELDGLREKATQGEWRIDDEDGNLICNDDVLSVDMRQSDINYIAEMHNAYPALRRAALAGAELAKAVESITSDTKKPIGRNEGGGTDWLVLPSIEQQRDTAIAAYRSAIEEKKIDCDDSTTEVTIATPDDFKCDRCDADYKHEHTTYSAVEEKNV